MKRIFYIQLMLFLLSLLIIFHVCIIVKLIPYDKVWGGRLTNDNEMYVFETISIITTLLLITILLISGGYINFSLNKKIVNSMLWVMFFIFILNTIGNILANTTFENLFSILTLLFALIMWKILRGTESGKTKTKKF